MPIAVYPGSLDPITFGHVGAIRDTAEGFGRIVVAIGVNPAKKYMFSLAERETLARQAIAGIPGASVTSFSGLLVHFLVRNDYGIVVRGLRNGQDFADAMLQESIGWQQTLAEGIKAFYVPARPGQDFVSSSALKAVLKEQGDATHLAPLSTIHAIQARMLGQYLFGVTGVSGSGKSYICEKFQEIAVRRGIPLFHVDLDKIGHEILMDECDPLYRKTRKKIEQVFGSGILGGRDFIDRKKLGEIVFGDPERIKMLNAILHDPVFFRMNDSLRGRKGIFLIDAALLAETGKTSLVNNQILVVRASQAEIARRLLERDNLTSEQIERRVSSQFSTETKISSIRENIRGASHGRIECLNNFDNPPTPIIEKAFDDMLKHIDIFGELRIASFLRSIAAANPENAYATLRGLYSGDGRFYHTLAHIVDGLDQLCEFSAYLEDKDAFTLAWLFHDAVYDSRERNNEENSAALLERLCESWGVDKGLIASAKRLVMATKHGFVKAVSADEKWLVDLDMSILGKSAAEYELYENNLRREYSWAPNRDWAAGRGDFLAGLRPPYFYTDHFIDRFGASAEQNIRRAIANLTEANG